MRKDYYHLVKPGIVRGNTFNAAAGFLFASAIAGRLPIGQFAALLAGSALTIASGCVYNNYLDRSIDKKMARTRKRALVTGRISARNALIFASALGIAGLSVLAIGTNWLTVAVGAIGLLMYVIVYGIAKRQTVYGTIVGSVAGSVPPVAGYTAVTNQLDGGAFMLLVLLTLWQMPHFYSIAMYRAKDYSAAAIPVVPLRKGARTAKVRILGYIAAFAVANVVLSGLGYTGYSYAIIMGGLGAAWLWLGLKSFQTKDEVQWGRGMFLFSLTVILALAGMLSVGPLLP